MNSNQQLAIFSDVAFGTSFGIYVVALLLSIVLYSRQATLAELTASHAERAARLRRFIAKLSGAIQILVWLGIVIHAASIVLRALSAGRFPFGNLYEYLSMITFGTMVITAGVIALKQISAMWPWMLVPVLTLMFLGGTKLYAKSAPVVPALQSAWLPIHVSTVVLGASISMVSGAFSALYLVRSYQPKGKERGPLSAVLRPLPSAQLLDRVAYKAAIWALPIFGLGIAFGAVWAEQSWGRFWNWDPKETFSFITWMLLAAYLHARATPRWSHRFAAWVNVAALATMLFNLTAVNIFASSLHSYAGLN